MAAIEGTQADWTIVPTQTPNPTYTPYPTPTTAPAGTPIPLPASSEMIYVPAGEFLMGCDPWDSRSPCLDGESPSHTMYLDDFFIDLTEVTNSQYTECVNQEACRPPVFDETDPHMFIYENPEYADHPVTNVDWYDARDYCNWVGKRMPSEAEWEKAARGWEDERFYPWGDELPNCTLLNFAGLNGDCPEATTPVGDYPRGASPYGALDMAGNVREWVADWYDGNYYLASPNENPRGADTGSEKVLRGGSYSSDWIGVRVNSRDHNPPTFRGFDIGFRCARDS